MELSPKWLFNMKWGEFILEWLPIQLRTKPIVNFLIVPFLGNERGIRKFWRDTKLKWSITYDRLNQTGQTFGLQRFLRKKYHPQAEVIEGSKSDKIKRYFKETADWFFKDTADVYWFGPKDYVKREDFIITGADFGDSQDIKELRADVDKLIPVGVKYIVINT